MALHDFNAIRDNMIELHRGKIYRVLEKCDKKNISDWWLLEQNHQRGYAPSSYIKVLDNTVR